MYVWSASQAKWGNLTMETDGEANRSGLSCDVRSTYRDDVDKETLCCHMPNNFSNPVARIY